MNWHLGWTAKRRIVTSRKLTTSELKQYETASHILHTFWDDQELFSLPLLNYEDYQDYFQHISEAFTTSKAAGQPDHRTATLQLNRRILNYLSSMRSYLDYTERKFKRRHGKTSAEVRSFLAACSREYDQHFSYRFLYRLRNYVQHFRLPISRMSGSAQVVSFEPRIIHRSVAIDLDRDSLLDKSFDWGKALEEEIRRLPQSFPIHPHMVQMMASLNLINLVPISNSWPDLLQAAHFVNDLAASIEDCEGTPCLLKGTDPNVTDPIIQATIRPMLFEAVDLVFRLEASFASNQNRPE